MRLFIATDFDLLKDYFAAIQKQTPVENVKINFTKSYHLTYKFLGDVPEENIAEIKEILQNIKVETFSVTLDHIGIFPSEDYIRIVWIGFSENEKMNALQKRIDNALVGLFKKETRFHPHITLARVKFVKDKKQFVDALKKIKVEKKTVEIKDFRLVKSTLTKEGAVYEDVGVFK